MHTQKMLRTIGIAGAIVAAFLPLLPVAAAEGGCDTCCSNSGVQVIAGDYECRAQYCDQGTGAGAGAGAGGAGKPEASAGATAGTNCTNGDSPPGHPGGVPSVTELTDKLFKVLWLNT